MKTAMRKAFRFDKYCEHRSRCTQMWRRGRFFRSMAHFYEKPLCSLIQHNL